MAYDEDGQWCGEVTPEMLIPGMMIPPNEYPSGAMLLIKTIGPDGRERFRHFADDQTSVFEHLGFLVSTQDDLRARLRDGFNEV